MPKIEIAESLIASYLKHVKKCLIVQTNWGVSSNWDIEETANNQTQAVYDKIITHSEFSDVFKKSELNQILRQSEVDAIGISISLNKIFLTEIAFHEGGLNYTGGKSETKKRIIKKLLRAYLTALQLFPNYSYEVIFAYPKVNPAPEKEIKEFFELLNNDFSSEQISFKYFSNEEFEKEILLPTIELSKAEADTSELFMRAIKLVELFSLINDKDSASNHDGFKAKPERRKRRKRHENIGEADKDVNEINKVASRIKGWAKKQDQINSKILTSFLELKRENFDKPITEAMLKERSSIETFDKNFPQMKTIAPNNHGKVFEQNGENITIWQPVILYVEEYEKQVFKS